MQKHANTLTDHRRTTFFGLTILTFATSADNDSWSKSAHRGKQIAIKPDSKKQICMEAVISGLKPNFIGIGLETFVS